MNEYPSYGQPAFAGYATVTETVVESPEVRIEGLTRAVDAAARMAEQAFAEAEQLRAEAVSRISNVSYWQERATTAERRHADDIALIGDRLIEEAQSREWCAEFDRIVDDLNGSLHVELPRRVRDYEVRVSLTIRINEARDEDDAMEQAESAMRSADRNASYSLSWCVDEAEEA